MSEEKPTVDLEKHRKPAWLLHRPSEFVLAQASQPLFSNIELISMRLVLQVAFDHIGDNARIVGAAKSGFEKLCDILDEELED